jgi:hypothetical protein
MSMAAIGGVLLAVYSIRSRDGMGIGFNRAFDCRCRDEMAGAGEEESVWRKVDVGALCLPLQNVLFFIFTNFYFIP